MTQFYLKNYRIGLDVDEVCANFLKGFTKLTGKDYTNVRNFNFSYGLMDTLKHVDSEFWLDLEPKFDPYKLPFLPTVYISTRTFHKVITETWLEKNGFPCAPVIHVGSNKIEEAKKWNLDLYVDDYIKNFQDLNAAGIKTLLMDATHNRQFKVGQYRLESVYDIPNKILELGW